MSKHESKKITRRRAMTVSLGAAGVAAVGTTQASAQSGGSLKGKRVLVGIGDFSEGMETYYMVYRLMEEGAVPVVAAAKAGPVHMVVHDFDPKYTNYTEKAGYVIQADVGYADVNPAQYDAFLIPGGRGPEEMRQRKDVLKITRYFMDKGLPIGVMCHGPQVLWAAGSVKGRRMTAYYGIQADLELAGAIFVDEPTVIDGPLVSSRGWPDLPDFMPKFLKVLAAS